MRPIAVPLVPVRSDDGCTSDTQPRVSRARTHKNALLNHDSQTAASEIHISFRPTPAKRRPKTTNMKSVVVFTLLSLCLATVCNASPHQSRPTKLNKIEIKSLYADEESACFKPYCKFYKLPSMCGGKPSCSICGIRTGACDNTTLDRWSDGTIRAGKDKCLVPTTKTDSDEKTEYHIG